MEEPFDKSQVKEPDLSYGPYSYADYLTWELDEMVELIQGKVFKKTAAPRRIHQYATTILLSIVYQKLTGGPCQVYPALLSAFSATHDEGCNKKSPIK
jgi:hypothetical protein